MLGLKHPLNELDLINEVVIARLAKALEHVDALQQLAKHFNEELDSSYLEEMDNNLTSLMVTALQEREELRSN